MPDPSYGDQLERGRRRFKEGHTVSAEVAFLKAIEMEPANHQAYVELACVYSELADVESDAEKKKALRKKEADLWWQLINAEGGTGVLGLAGLAEHYEGLGELETADDLYAEVAKRRPDYYNSQYEAALTLAQSSDPRNDAGGTNLKAALRTLLRLHKANKNWLEDVRSSDAEKERARLENRKVLTLISQLQIAYGNPDMLEQGIEILNQLSEGAEKKTVDLKDR